MSMVEKKEDMVEKKDDIKENEESKIKYRIRPTRYINYDCVDNSWEMEFHLPGVAKENVKFKILKDAYSLEATRDQALYHTSEYLPFEIDLDSVKAEYNNGLLYVSGKIKDPMADAVEIKLD
ncbi:MAG: Hsp20/alpha crystallin family protein [Candidatus Lokiarchaeota archaeon]|nr:Hsp20/alpha crystallin family protein [Candidatus Harpocratesius repetitus]